MPRWRLVPSRWHISKYEMTSPFTRYAREEDCSSALTLLKFRMTVETDLTSTNTLKLFNCDTVREIVGCFLGGLRLEPVIGRPPRALSSELDARGGPPTRCFPGLD